MARHRSRVDAALDNSEMNPDACQGFQACLALDARVQYRHGRHWIVADGIADITNCKTSCSIRSRNRPRSPNPGIATDASAA